jgi:pimeloyl-ACP methyl ester carboxylesterase
MGIYGDRDKVVHPRQWEPMKKGIDHAHIERFPLAGHFPMLEEPQNFAERLKSFLDQDEPAPVSRTSPSLSPTPSVTL